MQKFNAPAFLVVVATIGFFALVGILMFHEIPSTSRDIVAQLIGGIAAAFGAIVGYHFGSSSGSAAKQALLHELTGTGDGASKTEATIKTETVKKVTSEQKEGE